MKKPSKIQKIEYVWNRFLPFGNFYLMTFFGKCYIKYKDKDKYERDLQNGNININERHEMCHVREAQSIHNSWLLFYIKYIWQFIKNNPLFNGWKMAYKMTDFEIYAYSVERDEKYIPQEISGDNNWKKYSSLSLSERKRFYKEYKESRMTFYSFIQTKINPYLKKC